MPHFSPFFNCVKKTQDVSGGFQRYYPKNLVQMDFEDPDLNHYISIARHTFFHIDLTT